jgi:murein DD-endopeptidase MepM/ murein hydrolase activator NlpD
MNSRQIYGNHVVIDFSNGEFGVMCHFKKGSIRVKAGDLVKSHQILGLCGNSGNSSEPHLHIHLQDGKTLGSATGLPALFSNYMADGKMVQLGVPVRGQSISTAVDR